MIAEQVKQRLSVKIVKRKQVAAMVTTGNVVCMSKDPLCKK